MPGTKKITIILRRVAALVITAFAIPLSLARGVETMGVAAAPVLDDRYPAREHGFTWGVTGIADVTYSMLAGFRPLTLDLYLPKPSKPVLRRH